MSLIYIVGNKGNMASRYRAVLDHLGYCYFGHDKDEPFHFAVKQATHFLICTPTERHLTDIERCLEFGKPILCEKPFTKDYEKLVACEKKWGAGVELVSMVNQYQHLAQFADGGETSYDYFKSGSDGIFWDCINIIGLAKARFHVANRSAIWSCTINGKKLKLSDIDHSYVQMLAEWIGNPTSNWEYAKHAHLKVSTLEGKRCPTS